MTNVGFAPLPPGPACRAVEVTPSDSTVLSPTRGLWVGGAGDVAVTPAGQTDVVTFATVAAGTFLPITVTKVMAATTASDIIALI